MKKIRKTAVIALIASLALTAILSGCSTSISARKNDTSSTLYVGYVGTSFPTSFMPWLSRDGIAPTVASMIYSTLFSYDEARGDFSPLLGKSWCYVDLEGNPLTLDGTYSGGNDSSAVSEYYDSVQEDYMAVRIEIFDGIRWSDGEKVTVEDVYYSFDVATDNPLSNHAGALAWTADLKHESNRGKLVRQGMFTALHPDYSGTFPINPGEEDTVMYILVNKVLGAVTTLFNTILILPEHVWKPVVTEEQQLNNKNPQGEFLYRYKKPVGCGPWTLNVKETNTQLITLDRNPDYHLKDENGENLYKVEKIRLLLYLDSNTAIFAIKKGYIDLLDAGISSNYLSLFDDDESIYVACSEGSGVACLVLNVNPASPFDSGMKTLLADKDFRKALALAVNQEELVSKVLNGAGGTVSAGLIPKSNDLLYNPEADILSGNQTEKLAEANSVLDGKYPDKDSSGYRLYEGKRISFEILASPGQQDLVAYLQRQFLLIGVEVEFKAQGSAPETTYLYRSDFDMTVQSVILSMANADVMLRAHFVTLGRSSNYGRLSDAHIAESIEKVRYTLDRNEKVTLIRELQTEIAELYYKIPLYSSEIVSVARTDRFTGYKAPAGQTVFNKETLSFLRKVN